MVYGAEGTRNVIARLGDAGQIIWRRTDLPILQGHLTQAQLLVDFDDSILLYAVGNNIGRVAQIDLRDGETTTVFMFDGEPPRDVWVHQGSLFWVMFSEAGTHQWISQNLKTGQHRAIGQRPLQNLFDHAQGPLPGGGALLALPRRSELIWMGAEGEELGRLTLAGLVRQGDELVTGIRHTDQIHIARWQAGQEVFSLHTGPFGESSRLIAAESNKFHIVDGQKIVVVDESGNRIGEIPSIQYADERIRREAGIAIAKPVIEPSGSVLLAGADAEGAYIVKISLVA